VLGIHREEAGRHTYYLRKTASVEAFALPRLAGVALLRLLGRPMRRLASLWGSPS